MANEHGKNHGRRTTNWDLAASSSRYQPFEPQPPSQRNPRRTNRPPLPPSSTSFRRPPLPPRSSRRLYFTRMDSDAGEYSELDVSPEEIDKLVAEVIRYVLFKNHQSGCPIKREELVRLITKNYGQRALPSIIINEAQKKLSTIFGYEMKELQKFRPSSATQGHSSQQSTSEKSYVLFSQLPDKVYQKLVANKTESHVIGLAFVVIGVLQLAGGKMSEENLWDHLSRMGLNENDVSHSSFGNLKQTVEALVQQRYLLKSKINGTDGNVWTYELAERAANESVSLKMKEYMNQVVKNDIVSIDDED